MVQTTATPIAEDSYVVPICIDIVKVWAIAGLSLFRLKASQISTMK